MKTNILLIPFLLIITFVLDTEAQQVPNGGFENWSMKTINELDGFFSSNAMGSSDTGNVTKVTDAYQGAFAARLETVLSGNDTVSGMLLIGTPGNQTINGGLPYTGTPDSVSGYVKYTIQPNDTAFFIVGFKKNGNLLGQPAITTFTGVQSTYMRFSIPTYLDPMNPPDTMVAIITSSNMDPPQIVGSILTIDSIAFTNSPQQFPNGNCENWTALNSSANPVGWSSLNNFSMYGIPEMSFQTTDANSGNSALRIISDTATLPPPFGTNTLDTLSGYVFLGALDMDNSGIPYTERPISFDAYVKGTINFGGEASIVAELSKWNSSTQMREEVASAMYSTATSISNYTLISIPFNYSMPDIPDTLNIRIMAGNIGPGGTIMPGNEFFVDDLSFSLPVNVKEIGKDNFSVFPNPVFDKITIRGLDEVYTIEIYNLLGEKVYTNNLKQQTTSEIDLSSLQKGCYFIRVTTKTKVYSEKIVKQ